LELFFILFQQQVTLLTEVHATASIISEEINSFSLSFPFAIQRGAEGINLIKIFMKYVCLLLADVSVVKLNLHLKISIY
jgi:hypothetical protein